MKINTNLTAPIKLIAALLPVLQDNSNSAIVNVSSGLAIVPKAKSAVYCGTKAGIHIFSKSLRYQLDKVKVFEIIPPMVDTEMTKGRGKGKISPERLVKEFIKAFKNNRYEVNIHKVKLLRILNRIIPKLADRIMKGATASAHSAFPGIIFKLALFSHAKKNLKGIQACRSSVTTRTCRSFWNLFADYTKD